MFNIKIKFMKIKLFLFTFILFIYSCEKDNLDELSTKKEQDLPQKALIGAKGPVVYSSTFDWENINRYQTQAGFNVDMPWRLGVSANIPSSMKHNHPKSEGWEMLYNSLDVNNSLTYSTYFALYNKYLGVIHFFYVDPTHESAEEFYQGFGITGNSSLLNFEGVSNRSNNVKDYYPIVVKGPESEFFQNSNTINWSSLYQGFAPKMWYGAEIEFSYEDVSQFKDSEFKFKYIPFRGKTSYLDITGSLTGSITGTIEARSMGNSNLIGSIGNIFNSSNTQNANNVDLSGANVMGTVIDNVKKAKTGATAGFFSELWKKIKDKVPGAAQDNIVNTLTSAVNAGMKWASNPLSGFVSSLFSVGGDSQSVPLSKVDLKIDAKIRMTGTISSNLPNAFIELALPNTQFVQGGYGYPTFEMKDWNLGVWNVQDLPIANYDLVKVFYTDMYMHTTSYSVIYVNLINPAQAKINFNSRVLDSCNIVSQKIEYIVETGSNDHKKLIDSYKLEPFKYYESGNFKVQAYLFKTGSLALRQPYFMNFNEYSSNPTPHCGINVYARVSIVIKHKTNQKEFVHIKDFPLNYNRSTRIDYISENPGGDIPAV